MIITNKEIIATKGSQRVVYRIMGRRIYLEGKATPEYYQMLSNFKQKHALADHGEIQNWCYLDLIEEILIEDIHSVFVNKMIEALKLSGFQIKVREFPINGN